MKCKLNFLFGHSYNVELEPEWVINYFDEMLENLPSTYKGNYDRSLSRQGSCWNAFHLKNRKLVSSTQQLIWS